MKKYILPMLTIGVLFAAVSCKKDKSSGNELLGTWKAQTIYTGYGSGASLSSEEDISGSSFTDWSLCFQDDNKVIYKDSISYQTSYSVDGVKLYLGGCPARPELDSCTFSITDHTLNISRRKSTGGGWLETRVVFRKM